MYEHNIQTMEVFILGKQTFKFNTYWEQTAEVSIEANSLEDAMEMLSEMPLPVDDSEFVADSFQSELISD